MITLICGITPRRANVPFEDVAVARERGRALLDPRAARVVDLDERRAGLRGQVHHLADLLRHDLAHGPAEHREVLRRHEHLASVDRAEPRDDAVARWPLLVHAEVVGAMHGERVGLHERALVHEDVQAFAGRELAAVVLLLGRVATAGGLGRLLLPPQILDALLDGGRVLGLYFRSRSGVCRWRPSAQSSPAPLVHAGRPQQPVPAQGPQPASFTMRMVTMLLVRPLSGLRLSSQ